MKRKGALAACACVVILFSACYKKNVNTNSCDYDSCAAKAPATETAQLESYLSGAGITGATRHCSGMYYNITSAGTGKTPTICSYISVNYKGTLTDGTVFDQTSSSPAAFPLATLIDGWKNGIPLIKKGGRIRLYIPPSLGYGAQASTSIPANAILVFDIELVDVQ